MDNWILDIHHLHASIGGTAILKGLNLQVPPGEVHAIMGPNGAGKSTLAKTLAGHPSVTITDGRVLFQGQDLTLLAPEERAHRGLFLSFQYPMEIPGVNNMQFLQLALNTHRKARNEAALSNEEFLQHLDALMKQMQIRPEFKERSVNEGFSGGEKKRNEILQMALLEPALAILDETDSGLDIDALRIVADGVNAMRRKDRSMLIITHYQRLLDYIKPDIVHVLVDGQITRSGGPELAIELEQRGYEWI